MPHLKTSQRAIINDTCAYSSSHIFPKTGLILLFDVFGVSNLMLN